MLELDNLYFRIIRNNITELLKVINAKYPARFPRAVINNELEQIMENINLATTDVLSISVSNNAIKSKPKLKLDPEVRCHARIWDNIFDRNSKTEVDDIEDEFQVGDYNDININKFHKKYILGKQCARKKIPTTNYCMQHVRHRPHGNYLEPPSKELCIHFMIDGGYLENQDVESDF